MLRSGFRARLRGIRTIRRILSSFLQTPIESLAKRHACRGAQHRREETSQHVGGPVDAKIDPTKANQDRPDRRCLGDPALLTLFGEHPQGDCDREGDGRVAARKTLGEDVFVRHAERESTRSGPLEKSFERIGDEDSADQLG